MLRLICPLLIALLLPNFSYAAPAKAHAAKAKTHKKHAVAKKAPAKKTSANASAVAPKPVTPSAAQTQANPIVAPAPASPATPAKAAPPPAAASAAPEPAKTTPAAPLAKQAEWCAAIGKRLGSVPPAVCNKLGLQAAGIVSGRGHALMSRDITPPTRKVAQSGNQPGARARRILLIGGIHGDELTSASIVFRWLQWLDEADSEARQYHWRVIPVANPDGLLANPPQRMNSHGVDLNRNFPTTDWESDAHAYWAKKTNRDPRRFPGQKAMSEPETRWLHDQIEEFKPDVVVSVHAPFGILDYDGPAHQPRRFGHLNLNRLGIYPGSLGNYGGVGRNLPVITIELPNATSMPPATEQREIWEDMLTWLRRNIAGKTTS